MQSNATEGARYVIERAGLQQLIDGLSGEGYTVIGPTVRDGAVVLGSLARVDDLPKGLQGRQQPGRVRTTADAGAALFAHPLPMQGWKRYFYPPDEMLWRGRREGSGFIGEDRSEPAERYALLGVRACDLAAIRLLDRVFGGKRPADPRYVARREAALIVAVNCSRATAVCFCASMQTGPRVEGGYDLLLTELDGEADGQAEGAGGAHRFTVAVGSPQGETALRTVARATAVAADLQAEDDAVEQARARQVRSMVPDVEALLRRNLEHRQWGQVAKRCLGCASCTLVCPTCFCATVEDVTDLGGQVAERWRRWDSCFTLDFSHIHGGSIRRSGESRYRQWMTHKLSSWWQQFGTSGCVGCGRCIAWCPVGIDITEEARALRDSEGGGER